MLDVANKQMSACRALLNSGRCGLTSFSCSGCSSWAATVGQDGRLQPASLHCGSKIAPAIGKTA